MNVRVVGFAVAWQIAWFAGVLGAAHDLPWLGVIATVPVIILAGWHNWRAAGFAVGAGLVVGMAVDASLGFLGVLHMPGGAADGQLSPPWMWALWVQFALAVDICLAWLRRWWWLPVVFGGVGGSLAYFSGHRLHALVISEPLLLSLLIVAVAYAIATPLLFRIIPCSVPSR